MIEVVMAIVSLSIAFFKMHMDMENELDQMRLELNEHRRAINCIISETGIEVSSVGYYNNQQKQKAK